MRDKIKQHVHEDNEGVFKWVTNKGIHVPYSTHQVWEDLKPNYPITSWHHVVWFPQANPKHAFIMWLVIRGRLTTQDKLMQCIVDLSAKFPQRNQIWGVINRITLATVYHIWQERNTRIFKGRKRVEMETVKYVVAYIQLKLTTFMVRFSSGIQQALTKWDLELVGNRLKIRNCNS
ncbi:uncharacterized protein [Rutidosis leptorrhynchoides]|uniref:uncharacterized protein n=1 Tax=Rutidosis leptorrhynchoides TaxID=125765 RepID=UPI003A99C1FB